jgi:hypothetical protein
VAALPVSEEEEAELHSVGIFLAASAMGLVRGIVGFLTFLLLFDLRSDPTWHLGVVLGVTGGGALLGSVLAPRLREAMTEERMLMSVLAFAVVVGAGCAWFGGLGAAAVLSGTVAIVSTSGKLAFDSLVQRDAPDANRGRSFARFEVRFQLVWVVGAMLPLLLLPIPQRVGFLVVTATAAFALVSYLVGQRSARRSHEAGPAGAAAATAQTAIYDGEDEGDFDPHDVHQPYDEPLPYDQGPADDDADLAGWQINEPAWGQDRTAIDPERTRVQGYPLDPTELQ